MDSKMAADADRLSAHIYSKRINTSIWHKIVPKEPWVNGMSETQRVLTVERNIPDDTDTWVEIGTNGGSNNGLLGGSCVVTPDNVQSGSTERSFKLVQKNLKSDPICVEDGRNAFQTEQQIGAMYKNLTDAVDYTWKRHNMLAYYEMSERKVIAAPGLPESSSHFPNTPAQCILNSKILKRYYQDLIADSAELDGGSLGNAEGRPQFILLCSAETSDALFAEPGTNSAMLWNASRVPELLAPLGVDRALHGLYHTIEKLPRRWNFTGGVWVEVQPYEKVAATNGVKDRISAAYRAAPFEDSVIYIPSVMSLAVPGPITSLGGGTTFGQSSYLGKFSWLNVQHATDNPTNSWGFYYAELKVGVKPVHPEFGIVIRHLRCVDDLGCTACPEGTDPTSSELSDLADSSDVEFAV